PKRRKTNRRAGFARINKRTDVWLQAFDADVFDANDAFGIVGLKRKGALVEFAGKLLARLHAGGFGVFEHHLAVNLHGDLVAFHDDVLRPPAIVGGGGAGEVDDVIQTARLLPVAMTHVDLAFEPVLRPTGLLVPRVEIDSAV